MTASREPVAADNGAIAKWHVVGGVPTSVTAEERNDDISDFPGKILWACLRDDQHLWYKRSGLME